MNICKLFCGAATAISLLSVIAASAKSGSAEETDGWIDRYGQNAKAEWPQKVHSHKELIQADKKEENELRAAGPSALLDEYSAWKNGPKLKATGFFRLEKMHDRWWLVAPNGHLFYSTGIDCIGQGHSTNLTEKNRRAYSWLPSGTSQDANADDAALDFSNAVSSANANFYKINLLRKWNKQANEKFLERAVQRQRSWGFTTIGNWADDELIDRHKMPYVFIGPETWELEIPYLDGDIPDVYHPNFLCEAAKVASQLSSRKNDRWLIGYFIDNELPWWSIPYDVLALDGKQPAKIAWINRLKRKYGTIQALNKAWSVHAQSFDGLRWPGEKANATARKDMAVLMSDFAERFYSTWYTAVKKSDPNHLILGSRIPYPMDEIVLPCARHTDVLSFNHYAVDLSSEFDRYYRLTNKPMLIGEYGFDSLDAGLKSAFVPVRTQADRGIGFTYYTQQAAAKPYLVGSHYFQYVDEPLTGRGDGEACFNGFVSITDIPYPHLVSAARATNKRIYEIHAGTLAPSTRKPDR